jgi:hypothetical protein
MTGYCLEYILDSLSLDQVIMLHNYSFGWQETKSIILVNKIAECFFGVKGRKSMSDKPDLKKFYLKYGAIIKTPESKGKS